METPNITIIRRTDGKKSDNNEFCSKMIPAKCRKKGVGILIKLVCDSKGWCWKETYNNGVGHGSTSFYTTEDLIFDAPQRTSEKFYCAACGAKIFVKCSKCGHMTCWDEKGFFYCAYCDHKGEVSGNIKSVGTLLEGKK